MKYCFTLWLANVLFQDGEESALNEEKAISVHNPSEPILDHGIFSAQGSNPGLPHCRRILYQLREGKAKNLYESINIKKLYLVLYLDTFKRVIT